MTTRERAIVKLTQALVSGREATEAEVRRVAAAVDAITEHIVETFCERVSDGNGNGNEGDRG